MFTWRRLLARDGMRQTGRFRNASCLFRPPRAGSYLFIVFRFKLVLMSLETLPKKDAKTQNWEDLGGSGGASVWQTSTPRIVFDNQRVHPEVPRVDCSSWQTLTVFQASSQPPEPKSFDESAYANAKKTDRHQHLCTSDRPAR